MEHIIGRDFDIKSRVNASEMKNENWNEIGIIGNMD